MQSKLRLAVLATAGILAGIGTAHAATPSPVGQWTVSFYSEPNLARTAVHGICFKADRTWYSTTLAGFGGSWFQAAERFRWVGAFNIFAQGMFGAFSSTTAMAGEFDEFVGATGAASNVGNYQLVKTGRICAPRPLAAQKATGAATK